MNAFWPSCVYLIETIATGWPNWTAKKFCFNLISSIHTDAFYSCTWSEGIFACLQCNSFLHEMYQCETTTDEY